MNESDIIYTRAYYREFNEMDRETGTSKGSKRSITSPREMLSYRQLSAGLISVYRTMLVDMDKLLRL